MCDFLKNSEETILNEKNYTDYIEYENNFLIDSCSQDDLSEDEKISDNIIKKNNLPFTEILKDMKNIKINTEYKKWLSVNEDYIKDAYFIIQNKYLNDININNISLEEFSLFCFLSN